MKIYENEEARIKKKKRHAKTDIVDLTSILQEDEVYWNEEYGFKLIQAYSSEVFFQYKFRVTSVKIKWTTAIFSTLMG